MQQSNGRSNTAESCKPRGKPFVNGNDPRRNLKGRPKTFEAAREIAQALSHEEKNGKMAIERLLRSWLNSDEPTLQKAFVEYAFGKVPDKLETTGLENKPVLVLHFAHERQEASRN